jgi:hypothetical protein
MSNPFCHTQVECILSSPEEVDDFLSTLQDLVNSVDPVDLSDWETFTIYDLEKDDNKVTWNSSGYGRYKNLLEKLAENFPESKFAQIWLPCDISDYGNWGIDIYYDSQEQNSIELYSEDATDDPEQIGFAIVNIDLKTPEKYPRLYQFIRLAINQGFTFPKAADFECFDGAAADPESEVITFETLGEILDLLEDHCDPDFREVEIEFRVLTILAGASSECEEFEFSSKKFINFAGKKW